jgi:hypothetical protein
MENNIHNHKISIFTCNNKLFLNSTWYDTIINKVQIVEDYFEIGKNNYYKIEDENFLKKIDRPNENYYTTSFDYVYDKIHNVYEGGNMHIYTTNKEQKVKIIADNIKKFCSSPYLPVNTQGFCWLSSLISSIIYTDKINVIVLSKILSKIKKDVKYIIDFDDINFEKKFNLEFFHRKYMRFVTFCYIINFFISNFYNYETLLGESWGKKLIKNILFIQDNKIKIKNKINNIIRNSIIYKYNQI